MDDLSAMLNQIMSNPDAMRQIQSMASSLGLGGAAAAPQPQVPAAPSGGLDISALTALLQQAGAPPAPPPPASPDLSQLAAILQQAMGQSAPPSPPQQQTPDLSQLLSMLGGGVPTVPAAPVTGPNIDLNTLVKLSRAMSSLQANRANIDLLLALKPRLKDERAKKVDDAIRVMQIIQFLPLVKESGLFGEMDSILNGIGNFIGGSGLGGLFGGGSGQSQGGGLQSLLGNLVRR